MIWYSLEAFEKSPVDEVILVTGKEETDWYGNILWTGMGLKRSGQWSPEAQKRVIILSAGDCPPWTDRIRDQIWS